jgi:hypothetical protein
MTKLVVKLTLFILCLSICGIVTFTGIGALSDFMIHNRKLDQHATSFLNVQHPPDTSFVNSNHSVGLFAGNGNHCDYFVGEMRTFDGQQQKLESFYAHQRVADRRPYIAFVGDSEFAEQSKWTIPRILRDPQNWLDSPTDLTDNLYVVHVLVVGSEAGLDMRCR